MEGGFKIMQNCLYGIQWGLGFFFSGIILALLIIAICNVPKIIDIIRKK